MNLTALALSFLLFATNPFPSANMTSWMRPDSFRLHIGMPRADVIRTLDEGKWERRDGNDGDLIVDYGNGRALTLSFRKARLHAIRFELYVALVDGKKAFDEQAAYLAKTYGKPKKSGKAVIVYDNLLPNVMLVLSDDPKSEKGKQGVAYVAVRYYDPR